MERTAWTDERLDDLANRMDAGFERVDADIRDLRRDMQAGFAEVRAELRGEIGSVRSTMLRVGGGLLITQLGMIAALISGAG